jgi:hypothetical protein
MALVSTQVAIAVLLLAVADLFTASFLRAKSIDLGIDPTRVIVAQLDARAHDIPPGRATTLFVELAHEAAKLPDVVSVAVSTSVPFLSADGLAVFADGNPYPLVLHGSLPYFNAVTPEFLTTTGGELLDGRFIDETDRSEGRPVVVISQSLSAMAWPEGNSVGHCLRLGVDTSPCATVVGVVKSGRVMRLTEEQRALVYLPLLQSRFTAPRRVLVARSAHDPARLAPLLSHLIASDFPELQGTEVLALKDAVAPQWRQWSSAAVGCSLLAIMGLGLAAFGMYGAVAMQARARAQELAVRAALGATPLRIAGVCAYSTGLAVGAGLIVGLLGLSLISKPLAPLLFQTSVSWHGILVPCLILIGVAFLAVVKPTLDAVRSDIAAILKAD